MSIEKILIRTLIALALVFLVLALTFYPPQYALPPFMFLLLFIGAEFALPKGSGQEKKGLSKTAGKVVMALLILAVIASIASLLILWEVGPFWRLK